MYNVMANFHTSLDFDNLSDAEKAFDKLVADGAHYVELTKVIEFVDFDKYESIKIHW